MDARNGIKTNVIELKKVLVERGLDKITDLSKASTLDRNTISAILRGKTQPSAYAMAKLVETLHLEPSRAGEIFFSQELTSDVS